MSLDCKKTPDREASEARAILTMRRSAHAAEEEYIVREEAERTRNYVLDKRQHVERLAQEQLESLELEQPARRKVSFLDRIIGVFSGRPS